MGFEKGSTKAIYKNVIMKCDMLSFLKPMESKREGDSIQENQKLQACAGVSWLFIIGNVGEGAWSARE